MIPQEQAWQTFDTKINENYPSGSYRITEIYKGQGYNVNIFCGNCKQVHSTRYSNITWKNLGAICLQLSKRNKTIRAKVTKKLNKIKDTNQKQCFLCKEFKNLSEFYSDKNKSDKLSSRCKACIVPRRKSPEALAARRQYYTEADVATKQRNYGRHPERRERVKELRKSPQGQEYLRKRNIIKHGLTQERYDAFLLAQNGVCAICKQKPKNNKFHIDHDHRCCNTQYSCGKCVRGLLCGICNRGLGMFGDNPTNVLNGYNYLINYNNKKVSNGPN